MSQPDTLLLVMSTVSLVFAVAAAAGSVFALLRQRKTARLTGDLIQELRMATGLQITELKDEADGLRGGLSDLLVSMAATRDALDGKLTRSRRSDALRMLRTGSSPVTTASSLGLSLRDAELLARVSATISAD